MGKRRKLRRESDGMKRRKLVIRTVREAFLLETIILIFKTQVQGHLPGDTFPDRCFLLLLPKY